MKIFISLSLLILMSSYSFAYAYDESLMINVKKVSKLLKRAEPNGQTPDGANCSVELRRIEDGYYTLYVETKDDALFTGLDIEAYGPIKSHWTKRSFSLCQSGPDGSQHLEMKEDFSTKKLIIFSEDETNGIISNLQREIHCALPLKVN